VFGYCAEERGRWDSFLDANNIDAVAPALERGLSHAECLALVERAGIELPTMYKLGYKHNNCIGCAKATGAGYWNKIRRDFPDVFERMAQQERKMGISVNRGETRIDGKRVTFDPSGVLRRDIWISDTTFRDGQQSLPPAGFALDHGLQLLVAVERTFRNDAFPGLHRDRGADSRRRDRRSEGALRKLHEASPDAQYPHHPRRDLFRRDVRHRDQGALVFSREGNGGGAPGEWRRRGNR
jgi:hypothetical protein